MVAFGVAKKRKQSLLGAPMQLPTSSVLTPRLILGSLAFGVGWGLAGFCPGPALVSAAAGYGKAILFVVAMLVGMVIYTMVDAKLKRG